MSAGSPLTDRTAISQLQMNGQDIPWLLETWATNKPDHPALVWDPPEGVARKWTYAELLEGTRGMAVGLRDLGLGLGDRVLIHAENSPEMLLAWLACAMLGAVAVTTNTRSVVTEITYFAGHTGCVAAITDARHADAVAEAAPYLKWVAVIPDGDDSSADDKMPGYVRPSRIPFTALSGHAGSWTGRPIEPMLPFGIMFTSGTTSRPKAVVHTHANAVWASRIGPRNIDLGTDDRYLIYLPLFHVNAQSWSFFSVLGVGATAVLMPKWSSSRFWEVVTANEITHISLMPFCFGTIAGPDRPTFTTLRIGVFGLIMPALDTMLGIDVYAAYGMTETVIHATSGKPFEHLPERSMGRITPGYEFAVVDQETGTLCAEGETGELWLRGTRGIQLFLEYYDNDEANAKAFVDDWFKTGDMVVLGTGGNVFYREPGQGPAQGGWRECLGPRGRGGDYDGARRRPGRGGGQARRFPGPSGGGVRGLGPGRRRRGPGIAGHRDMPDEIGRLQGAAGGLRRRWVSPGNPGQAPQEQTAGDGRRTPNRMMNAMPSIPMMLDWL